jgi:hypothetical protein
MSKPARYAVRIILLAALVAALPVALSSSVAPAGPYLSALSDLGAPAAVAATTCNNKACTNAPRGLKFTCVSSPGTNCKTIRGGVDCAVSTC